MKKLERHDLLAIGRIGDGLAIELHRYRNVLYKAELYQQAAAAEAAAIEVEAIVEELRWL